MMGHDHPDSVGVSVQYPRPVPSSVVIQLHWNNDPMQDYTLILDGNTAIRLRDDLDWLLPNRRDV